MGTNAYSRRRFLQSMTLAGGALALGACGGGSGSGKGGTLTYWNQFFPTSSSTDKSLKRDDFWVIQSAKRFADANGINVVVTDLPGDDSAFTKFRTAGVARNGPDVASLWSGAYTFGLKSYITPLDKYVDGAYRSTLTGWEVGTEGLVAGKGTLYGIPPANDGIAAVYFDSRVLDRAGAKVSEDTVLEWDQWLEVLRRIKATGVTPLALGNGDYTLFSLFYWIAQVTGGETGLRDLGDGTRKFNDPALQAVVRQWLQLVPYALPNPSTMDDPVAQVGAGKAAVVVQGPWAIAGLRDVLGQNVLMTRLPNINATAPIRDSGIGGPGGDFVVTSYSKHKDEAAAFIKHLTSKTEQLDRIKNHPHEDVKFPNLTGVDLASLFTDPLLVRQAEWVNQKFVFYADNIWPTDLVNEIYAQAQLIWAGKKTPEAFLSALDDKRDSIVKNGSK
ncbi:MAG: extracellular solute-binding protein [Micromonosporaceae bacterium]|nr:extracellular solute-binding protein [Micromonosporaceae bacterium]